MPYIITPCPRGCRAEDMEHRTAVASLDDAREVAWEAAGWTPDAPDVLGGIHDVRRSHGGFTVQRGGTIGPLPDGSVIDVQPISWQQLAAIVWPQSNAAVHPGLLDEMGMEVARRAVLTAFNA